MEYITVGLLSIIAGCLIGIVIISINIYTAILEMDDTNE